VVSTKKKVCLLGTFGVGKTSLIRQFVEGIFSEKYLSTVGVKIDRKVVTVEGAEVMLLIWDLAGEDEFQRLRTSYMKGASGFIYVADGTREETFKGALGFAERAEEMFPGVPSLLLVNKSDLASDWEVDLSQAPDHLNARKTSALSGEGVEESFERLAAMMVNARGTFL